ncbi:hypothetical protein TrCOL_g9271 [Triparma columacea]|nr:hypothetical protein TrCOL_g9271 [Triparma columacea]
MLTSRDLLRQYGKDRPEEDPDYIKHLESTPIEVFMTPLSKVVFCRPDESVRTVRSVMAKVGVKALPIMSKDGRVEGIVTSRDITDFGLEAKDKGGKESYLKDMAGRVGMMANASMAEPPVHMESALRALNTQLFVNVGTAKLPHPFKTSDGVAGNKRIHGAREYATDVELSEDAEFIWKGEAGTDNGTSTTMQPQPYAWAGVADGVGSWREYGVDPREFSRALMEGCRDALVKQIGNTQSTDTLPRPSDLLREAHETVKERDVVGSSTACVMLFDGRAHQINFSNLGDSGIIVLRHIDSSVAGVLKRDRVLKREEKKGSDLRVSFVSQQQLKSFNHPYQFGWLGKGNEEDSSNSFKSSDDLCTSSIHVRRGDIIIMATDGLFDNVDVDDITSVVQIWEMENGFVSGNDLAARERRWEKGITKGYKEGRSPDDLAMYLCELARKRSLRDDVDSPFAMLAKENDIMWSGGMPDDCTVIVAHVVGEPGGKK